MNIDDLIFKLATACRKAKIPGDHLAFRTDLRIQDRSEHRRQYAIIRQGAIVEFDSGSVYGGQQQWRIVVANQTDVRERQEYLFFVEVDQLRHLVTLDDWLEFISQRMADEGPVDQAERQRERLGRILGYA